MGNVISNLKVLFSADTSQFKKGMTDAEKSMKQFQAAGNLLKSVAGPMLAAFSVGAVVDFGRKAAEAADIELQAQSKLLVALKGRQGVTDSLIKLSAELQTKTLFGDEQTVGAAATLAMFVKNEDQLKSLIPVVQDFATAYGMDLDSAAKAVGKSIGSSTNALKRYGIDIEGAAGSSERAASAVAGLTDKFKGQAEAAGAVGLGPVKILQNMIGDVVEDLGKWLMPAIQAVSKALIKAFPKGLIDTFRSGLIDLINWFIELYNESALFRANITLIGTAFSITWDVIKAIFVNIKNLFSATGKLLKAVFTGNFAEIPEILKESFDKTKDLYVKTGKEIAGDLMNGFNAVVKPREKINLISKEKAKTEGYGAGVDYGEGFGEGVKDGIAGKRIEYNPVITPGATAKPAGQTSIQSATPVKVPELATGQSLGDLIKNQELQAAAQKAADTIAEMNASITSSMQDMAAGFGEAIGNMITGTGNIGDIGKMLLSGVGDLAIQLGKIAIGTGIAMEAIKTAFQTLGGLGAIAAGIALIALGTAVKGAVSGAAGGGGGMSGRSGSSGTYDLRTSATGATAGIKQQKLQVEIVGQTTIKNGDIRIAYQKAENYKRINT